MRKLPGSIDSGAYAAAAPRVERVTGRRRFLAASVGVMVAAGVKADSGQPTGTRGAAFYPPVTPGRALDFPQDHGAHPDYRTEWWYLTADLTSSDGPIGLQITFFRVRTVYGEDNPSRFAPTQLLMAHAAVVDVTQGTTRHAEQAYRTGTPIAEFDTGDTRLAIGNAQRRWTLVRSQGDRYHCRVSNAPKLLDFGFDIEVDAGSMPALQGDHGYMQKGPDPLFASYYYSRPQARVHGSVRLDERRLEVSGKGWIDHEWMSTAYAENSPGWDWMGLNLDTGGALTVYRIRSHGDDPIKRYVARLQPLGGQGAGRRFRTNVTGEVVLTPLRHWTSPKTGGTYPIAFRLEFQAHDLVVLPRIDSAEFDATYSTNTIYWEGPVTVWRYRDFVHGLEPEIHRRVGHGYLELTGYARPVRF